MGLGATTGGTGGELSVEFARALVLLIRDLLSVSLSEAAEVGREVVSTEEVRRMTLPIRADHFGLGLTLLMAEESGLAEKRGWERPEATRASVIYKMPTPGGWVEASCGPDTSHKRSNVIRKCKHVAYKIHVVPCPSPKTN